MKTRPINISARRRSERHSGGASLDVDDLSAKEMVTRQLIFRRLARNSALRKFYEEFVLHS